MKQAIQREISAHGIAFDQGLVPCQRLVEILMVPFLKLGQKAIQLQGTSAEGLLDDLASCCFTHSVAVISGDLVRDSQGVRKFRPVLQPKKRSELVKALLKAAVVEVRFFG